MFQNLLIFDEVAEEEEKEGCFCSQMSGGTSPGAWRG